MTRLVPAGAKGVDFSFARPPAGRLVELGYSFVVGYLSVPPSAPAKNITKADCDAYLAAGLAVLLVWEMSATRASLGAAYGTADGKAAAAQAFQRGYPGDVPILVADDTNTTSSNIAAQEAYMRAFAAACRPYPIGIYGDVDILGRCKGLWQIGWLPNAWAWSGASRADAEAKARTLGAHVLQRTGFYIDNTWAVDPNEAIAPFPAWGLAVEDDDDMPVYLTNRDAGKYGDALQSKWQLMDDGGKRGIGYPHEYTARGEPTGRALDDATLDGIPDWAPPAVGTVDQAARDAVQRVGSEVADLDATVDKVKAALRAAGT